MEEKNQKQGTAKRKPINKPVSKTEPLPTKK